VYFNAVYNRRGKCIWFCLHAWKSLFWRQKSNVSCYSWIAIWWGMWKVKHAWALRECFTSAHWDIHGLSGWGGSAVAPCNCSSSVEPNRTLSGRRWLIFRIVTELIGAPKTSYVWLLACRISHTRSAEKCHCNKDFVHFFLVLYIVDGLFTESIGRNVTPPCPH